MGNRIIIYTDAQGRVFHHQDQDNTLTQHEVYQLPSIPEETLKDGYHIYIDGEFSFGYELNENKCYGAINNLKAELRKTDYITHKELDGEDLSIYGDYKAPRKAIRLEINDIELQLKIK